MKENKTRSTELEGDARKLQDALSELVRIYQFRDKQRICYYDISVTQCYALQVLIHSGSITLNQLAAELYLDKSTTSRVVDVLEEKQYVVRTPHPEDARALKLKVTKKGQNLHARIVQDQILQMKELIADFSPEVRKASAKIVARLAVSASKRFRNPDVKGCS